MSPTFYLALNRNQIIFLRFGRRKAEKRLEVRHSWQGMLAFS